ncbi:hypothetical protein ACHAWU_006949 [Discostella pseudostelligera]|uniref:50S ribosomal protein L35 n=1 Tax=Discostella pseudostelligera TaxID=259834 RepID=A0ABD3N0P9_9STRA
MTTMMFSALVRSALPPLRSASSHTPSPSSFACLHNNYARSSLSCWFNNNIIRTPLFLMSGIIREKSCLQTNKSAAKRFIVRGNGRIKRGKAGRSHNTGHKGRKRINRLAASAPITEKAIEERMRRIIRA